MSAWRVSKRRQGINESERQISSLLRRFAWKVDRRAAKTEPQIRPGNQRARWGAYRLLAPAQNPPSIEAPYTRVAAAFVEALAVEAEGAPKQVLATFVALVAARQETVTECFGAFSVKEAYSADETPAAQRKAKVTMAFNALGVLKSEGVERGNAGRRARGKGRETSNRPDAESERSREGGRRSEDRAGAQQK